MSIGWMDGVHIQTINSPEDLPLLYLDIRHIQVHHDGEAL